VGSFVPFLSLLFRLSEYFKEPNAMFDYFHRGGNYKCSSGAELYRQQSINN